MTNYAKKAIQGTLIVFIFMVSGAFLSYFIRLVLARSLSISEFGLFFSIFTFVFFLNILREFGLGLSFVKHISEFRAKKQFTNIKSAIVSVILSKFILGVMLAIIIILLSKTLSINYFKDPTARPLLILLSVMVIISVFGETISNFFQGMQKNFLFALYEPLKNSIILTLIIIFLRMNLKSFSPALAYVLVYPLLIIFYLPIFLKNFKFFKYKTSISCGMIKRIFLFGLPLTFTILSSKIISDLDVLVLTAYRSLTEVGVYSIILPTSLMFLFLGNSIAYVLLPLVTELNTLGLKKIINECIRVLYKYSFAIILPLMMVVLMYTDSFIIILFGNPYVAGSTAFRIILIGTLFYVIAIINNSILTAIGKPKIMSYAIIIGAVINLILNLLLIPQFGINGAAVATSVSYILVLALSVRGMLPHVKVRIPWKDWSLTFLSGVIVLFTIYILKRLLIINFWLEISSISLVAILVYIFLLYLFRVVDFGEIKRYIKLGLGFRLK